MTKNQNGFMLVPLAGILTLLTVPLFILGVTLKGAWSEILLLEL